MSNGAGSLVETIDSLFSEVRRNLTSRWESFREEFVGQENRSFADASQDNSFVTENIFTQTAEGKTPLEDWISGVTRETVHFLQNTTENSAIGLNNTVPEVTFNRQEVTQGIDIDTAEKVVIGAAIIVAVLAAIGIILRLCRPRCRAKTVEEKDSIQNSFGIEVSDSKLSGYSNLGLEVASNSSGTGSTQSNDWSQSSGSNPSTDWSDLSSDVRKESDQSQTDTDMPKKNKPIITHTSPEGSTELLNGSLSSEDRLSSKSSPLPQRRVNDEVLSVISTHSLEPLRLEQAYRNRWDDQWDPYGSFPRGNLSHHSHPSESRLSLNSFSSHSSSTTFPIPNRDTVKQLNMDQTNRYPSNLKLNMAAKKEKHVRLSPPNDR